MFNTYNLGVGMSLIVSADTADAALAALKEQGEDPYIIGQIVAGEEKILL